MYIQYSTETAKYALKCSSICIFVMFDPILCSKVLNHAGDTTYKTES